MAINIIHCEFQHKARWGVVEGTSIALLPGEFSTTAEFIKAYPLDKIKSNRAEETVPQGQVKLLSPVTSNQQFLCQGANYRQHMIESGVNPDQKSFNMFFTKAGSCITSANSAVEKPTRVKFLDYEVELGLVLRQDILKPVKVNSANLHDYVAALVIVNDYSARDIQIPQMQFYKGKSFRTFGPVGPYLCMLEPSDMPLLRTLNLKLTVNGQLRQSDNTANLVFGPEVTLTEWSGVHDLHCGDLIATGTPAGCALAVPSPAKQRIAALIPESLKWKVFMKVQAKRSQYLKEGDVVRASISSSCGRIDLGEQHNVIVTPTAH
ncbi:MAG TPA: fumarylacetoacetate hydrolase family protein [Limnobacter sp.]|nr:fumarylacetoacetate hydrolase family protein [Limnobacter sp.]